MQALLHKVAAIPHPLTYRATDAISTAELPDADFWLPI
jgi:hypothetical protein